MSPIQQHSSAETACSPSFVFSPIDTGDVSSDDGDALQTPLHAYGHVEHHPFDDYHQHREHLLPSFFSALHSNTHVDPLAKCSNPVLNATALDTLSPISPVSPLSPLDAPSASELQLELPHDPIYTRYCSPSPALDLANASLEISHFESSSRRQDYSGSSPPYITTNQLYDPFAATSSSPSSGYHNPSVTERELSPLPTLLVENFGSESTNDAPSLLLSPHGRPGLLRAAEPETLLAMKGRMYSPRFPADHLLHPVFVRTYHLDDELGAGGYGFVMTARHRGEGHEVAVKFIIKDKVPEHAWWEDEVFGKVPTEVMLLSLINHENIVRCLDLFEDEVYFYLVQELHGTPWVSKKKKKSKQVTAPGKLVAMPSSSMPSLTPSPSYESNVDSLPNTPPQVCVDGLSGPQEELAAGGQDPACVEPHCFSSHLAEGGEKENQEHLLQPVTSPLVRPNFSRRPSYDLFECIEQSKHKRLSENQARYIFAQVVEAVHYLDSQGITHCDIKDENLVVDSDMKVKLIDFGSAVVADPSAPRPYYTLFFGTTAYAASEILLKKPYRAPPAEIWTLGVLLSYLLTGHSPFPTEQDAKDGRIILREPSKCGGSGRLSRAAVALMGRCLEKEPDRRADINEVRGHRWLQGALESRGRD